jgi:predicted DNA binding CopG/RHH family protein
MTELDNEEKDFLETFEAGEWQSVKEPARLQELQGYAKAALAKPLETRIAKDKRITLRLSSIDLESIQTIAVEEGIPYQTLISSILHKYVTGRLVDQGR